MCMRKLCIAFLAMKTVPLSSSYRTSISSMGSTMWMSSGCKEASWDQRKMWMNSCLNMEASRCVRSEVGMETVG